MLDYLNAFFDFFSNIENPLLLMFSSAFLSSTLLPGNSEIVFTALAAQALQNVIHITPLALLACATIGNSIGSFTTYAIARQLPQPQFNPQRKISQWAIGYSQRYGVWSLLLSWLPILGDLLCGVAGWLRFNPWQSAILIMIAKAARYAALYWGVYVAL